ncbi:MAG: RNA helicase [Bacilli bacterium]|nr:RNA helicase [Bacilli bacterium]
MKRIKLEFDFLSGPITKDVFNPETKKLATGVTVIDNDSTLETLNAMASRLFSSCYDFEVDDQPCVFNMETARKNKNEILGLLVEINKRLAEINDGSFLVDDLATKEIESW